MITLRDHEHRFLRYRCTMTDITIRTVLPLRPGRLGDRAVRALLHAMIGDAGPRSALVVGAGPHCPVLAGALTCLGEKNTLTVLPDTGSVDAPAAVAGQAAGRDAADRIRIVASLDEAEPADVVVLAQPLSGSAEQVAGLLAELREKVTPGGTLAAAAAIRPGDPAAIELRELSDEYGVGSDLVLRNNPPLRVHRLRFTPAEPAAAERRTAVTRPSSVRLTRRMHLDSNGVFAGAACAGAAMLLRKARPTSWLWLVPALAAVPVAAFFRDPERDTPKDRSAVVAASDGTVLSVERLHDDKFGVGDGDWVRVAVFLSVLDVHVNRSPVAGRVLEVFREQGGYAPAMKPDAEHNVAAYTVLETVHGPAVVAQRTGLVARRIVHRVPAGALLARGERFGLIRFGSRTDVYLPAGAAEALVAPGDKVSGGSTVIARWH